jgi:methylmalonyl-CoA/ethylmalonyl-CoA epimerase
VTTRRIDHTAIVVRDLNEAIPRYEKLYDGVCRERSVEDEQRVEIAFIEVGDTQLELISPIDKDSGVARFLFARGETLHHVAVRVDDIAAEIARLAQDGVKLIDAVPRRGAHGLIAFVHPKSTGGVLLELVQPP